MSKRGPREDIRNTITELHSQQLDREGAHLYSHIEPFTNSGRTPQQIALDSLARVITGPNDVCAAVVFDGQNLLVANNPADYGYAVDYMGRLRAFAKNPSPETYGWLKGKAYDKIEQFVSEFKKCLAFFMLKKSRGQTTVKVVKCLI